MNLNRIHRLMKKELLRILRGGLCCVCLVASLATIGCGGSSEPTVVEPDNEEQLELMRQMVEGETRAVEEAEASRE